MKDGTGVASAHGMFLLLCAISWLGRWSAVPVGLLILSWATSVQAQLYWDTNGSTSGAGGATPSGIWDNSTSNWNDNSGGTTGTTRWSANNTAIFSAGTDATGAFTITVAANTTISGVGGITFEEGTVNIAAGNGSSTLNIGPIGATINTVSGTHTIGVIIDGSSNVLTKQGNGTLILSGNNNFGQLDLFAGEVRVSSDANLGASSGLVRFWGGTIGVTSSFSTSRNFTLDNGSGGFNIIGAGTTLTLTSGLSGSSFYNLDKSGAGTLELTQSSSRSGNTTISAGKIKITNGGALGSGQVTVNSGTLEIANCAATSPGLVLNNGSTLLGTGTASYSKNGSPSIGNGAAVTVATASASDQLTIGSEFRYGDSSSVVTFNGPGTVVLSKGTTGAANAYQGSFVLSSGTLRITDYLALATTGLAQGRPLSLQGGTLDLRADGAADYRSNTTVSGNAIILSQRQTSGAGQQQSFGTLSINDAILTVNSGATVTSGTQTVVFGNTTLTGNATFNVNNGASAATQLTLGAVSQDAAGRTLTKSGSGTLILSGAGSYSGATTVNAGTLTSAATSGSALGSTSSITVNSGGTLLLGASDQINNTAEITLAGGTLGKGNFSEGAADAVGAGALTLTDAGSHLDFGSGAVGVLTFANFTPGANTLVIDNWTGTAATVGSAGTDRLIFNAAQATNLGSFSFTGYTGAVEIALDGGYFEVVPLTAVPEPSTWIPAVLAFLALVYYRRSPLFKNSFTKLALLGERTGLERELPKLRPDP